MSLTLLKPSWELTRPPKRIVRGKLPSLHRLQKGIWDDLESPASLVRFAILNCGRQWGKTRLGTNWVFYRAMRGQTGFSVAPDYPRSKVIWRKLVSMAERTPGCKVFKTERMITFASGGWIYMKSAEDPNSLRSEGLNFVHISEAAYVKEIAWTGALRAVLLRHCGDALIESTPAGYNWFYDLFNKGQSPEFPTYRAYHYPSHTSPFLSNAELEGIRAEVSEETYLQEYMAQFLTVAGRVFKQFRRTRHVKDDLEYLPGRPIDISWDFGTGTCAVGLYQRVDDTTYKIGEATFHGETTLESLANLLDTDWRKDKRIHFVSSVPDDWQRHVLFITPDPTGGNKDSSVESADIREINYLRDAFPQARVLTTWKPRLRSVEAGCKRLRDKLLTTSGKIRRYYHPCCVDSIKCMEQYVYPEHKPGHPMVQEPLKDGVHDHHIDGERYHEVNHYPESVTKIIRGRRPV